MKRFALGFLLVICLFLSAGHKAFAEEGDAGLLQLHQYKPIYFLMGHPYTKIEFSFKTQLFNSIPVYFGYTQLMFWDLFTSSPVFQDISYDPLIFYRFNINQTKDHWIDFIPIEHESNGKGGTDERSWNRIGVAYNFGEPISEPARFYMNIKAWIPVNNNPNNNDIDQYRGIWEINACLSHFLGPFFGFDDLNFRFYPGGKSLTNPFQGGQELGFRMRSKNRAFLPILMVQVFHGYGESLIDYQDNRWGIRGGISF